MYKVLVDPAPKSDFLVAGTSPNHTNVESMSHPSAFSEQKHRLYPTQDQRAKTMLHAISHVASHRNPSSLPSLVLAWKASGLRLWGMLSTNFGRLWGMPASPNYPLRLPTYYLMETIRLSLEVHWGSR